MLSNSRYHGNRMMANVSGRDGMRPLKFRRLQIGSLVGISNIFKYGGRPPSLIFKILIFGHVNVIEFLTCYCVPNFIQIGSRVWPVDAHNC